MVFANRYNVPFLAVNRGHGTAPALSNVKNGINIYVRALDSIKIAEDGKSALMGGGTYVDEVINELAAHGKVSRMRIPHFSQKLRLNLISIWLLLVRRYDGSCSWRRLWPLSRLLRPRP